MLPSRSELLLQPYLIGRLRFGDRNGSPTWPLNAELHSYAGIVSSGSFSVWQACFLRLIASCFQTISTRISIIGRKRARNFARFRNTSTTRQPSSGFGTSTYCSFLRHSQFLFLQSVPVISGAFEDSVELRMYPEPGIRFFVLSDVVIALDCTPFAAGPP